MCAYDLTWYALSHYKCADLCEQIRWSTTVALPSYKFYCFFLFWLRNDASDSASLSAWQSRLVVLLEVDMLPTKTHMASMFLRSLAGNVHDLVAEVKFHQVRDVCFVLCHVCFPGLGANHLVFTNNSLNRKAGWYRWPCGPGQACRYV